MSAQTRLLLMAGRSVGSPWSPMMSSGRRSNRGTLYTEATVAIRFRCRFGPGLNRVGRDWAAFLAALAVASLRSLLCITIPLPSVVTTSKSLVDSAPFWARWA